MTQRAALRAQETEALLAIAGAGRAEHDPAEVAEAEGRLSVLAEKPVTPEGAALRREGYIGLVVGLLFIASAFGYGLTFSTRFMSGGGINDFVGVAVAYAQLLFGLGLFAGGVLFSRRMEPGRRILVFTLNALAGSSALCAVWLMLYVLRTRGLGSPEAWSALFIVPLAIVLAFATCRVGNHFRSADAKAWCRREPPDETGDVTALGGIELIINVGVARPDNERAFVENCEAEIRRRAAENWRFVAESFRKARKWLIVFGVFHAFAGAAILVGETIDRSAEPLLSLVSGGLCLFAGAGLIAGALGINSRRRWGRFAVLAVLLAFAAFVLIPILSAASGAHGAGAADVLRRTAGSLGMLVFFAVVFFLLWKYFTSWKARLWCRG